MTLKFRLSLAPLALLLFLSVPVRAAELASTATAGTVDPTSGLVHPLSEFGPIAKPQEMQETYQKAIEALRKTGGVLTVPKDAWKQVKHLPLQGLIRTPEAPAQTKQWKDGPGVTVITSDQESVVVQIPPLSGVVLDREIRLAPGDSLPHWGTHPAILLNSKLVAGSVSYLDWLQAPVEKGLDRRFYVATIRGIRPGQFLNLHGGPGYGGGVVRGAVKSLGFDVVKNAPYFVADTDINHTVGAILQNKSNTGLIHMTQTSHNDNQTYDFKIIRNQYAHGDTYMYYCDFNYMSNVHSAAGDENGNCYAAFVRSMDNNFRGTIETANWAENTIKFSGSSRNVETLGDSRPLVNLNPKKAITAGTVVIVPAESYTDTIDTGKYKFQGKTYPTQLLKNPVTGVGGLKMGGLIRGDKECPWTQEVVGRYFAISSPEEKTPKGNFRWYLITGLRVNSDGTKEIEIRRYWWGAKDAGSPTLYTKSSYSWDDHIKPLNYIIAPGTYVNDVSRAIPGGDRGGQRILGVAPYRDINSPFDFEAGDPVEQAIGPDPFKPQVFRSWLWEDVPGPFPSSIFDLANNGAASRHAVFWVHGGGATLEAVAKRKEEKPSWDNFFVFDTAVGTGMSFRGDVTDAAIKFEQPTADQPIKWKYAQVEGQPAKEASLTVSRETGELNFQGEGVRVNGAITAAKGISGDNTPAKNLRGKNVPVTAAAKSIRITFPQPEADGDYAVFIEQSWLTERAISDKGPDGFTVSFAAGAPENAKVDWMLVR